MYALELKTIQKSMLIKMSIKLFPEYTFDFSYLDSRSPEIKFWNDEMKTARFIHWFEFCTTILFRRINYPKDIVNNSPLINVDHILNSGKHPIDYLYSEFLKLSK